jgi:hypothetical protein
MAGLTGRYVYVADDTTEYWGRFDASNSVIAGMTVYDGTNAAGGRIPKGLFPRKRYLRHPSSGRERSIVCGNTGDSLWTGAVGTVQALFDFGTNASADYTLAGRTGEKMKAI